MKVFYIPCPDQLCAEKICEELLKDKLIGCGNILPHMTSMYWWEGKIEKSLECVLILKTSIQAEVLEKKIRKLHPYSVPCILEIPVASINEDYKNWLANCIGPT